MRKKMFLRLLIEYLIFGIICFLTISLLIPKMVHTHTVKKEAAAMYRQDRKSTRLNSSHMPKSRMPSSA